LIGLSIWIIREPCESEIVPPDSISHGDSKNRGQRSLGIPRRRWDNLRMDLKEIGANSWNWFDSSQDRDY